MAHDTLKVDLNLTVGSETASIPGGNIKAFALDLQPWGFTGMAEFVLLADKREDTLFPLFVQHDRMEARLSIAGVLNQPEQSSAPLSVTGLVTDKGLYEMTLPGVRGEPVLYRRYTVRFTDPAGVLWRQHFPTLLDAEASLTTVIKQQLAEGISLDLSWSRLKAERPMICLPLGECETSFYDFVVWFADRFGGSFHYDYENRTYGLSEQKVSNGAVGHLRPDVLERLQVHFPETLRCNARVLNASTEAPGTLTVSQEQADDRIFRDVLVCSSVTSEVDERKSVEARRLRLRKEELELTFDSFPHIACWPGARFTLQHEFFAATRLSVDKTFRFCRVQLKGRAKKDQPSDNYDASHILYTMELDAVCEREDDQVVKLPPHQAPRFPVFAEGKVVCDMGDDGDRSYMVFTDSKTSQSYYKVYVPLWNKTIMVPFAPDFMPGHLYMPAFKDSRVMLALYFDRAEIVRFLNWGADVQLPMDGQGNHLLFGKNKTSETSARHDYVDSKPVLSIQRMCDGDVELMRMEDGTIVLETKEDASAKKGMEKFDLTPQVGAARAKLTMASKSSIANISGGFEKTSGSLNTEIEAAVGQTRATLDQAEGAVRQKASQVTGLMEAAVQQLSKKTDEIKGSAEKIKSELKKEMGL